MCRGTVESIGSDISMSSDGFDDKNCSETHDLNHPKHQCGTVYPIREFIPNLYEKGLLRVYSTAHTGIEE